MEIKISNCAQEQAELGRAFAKEKNEIYNESLMMALEKAISENMPDSTEDEKEEMLYRSIYDYWVYGNNVSEEFYYRFYQKSHEEKSKYVTCKSHLLYVNHLNEKRDAYLLNDKYTTYLELKEDYKRDVVLLRDEKDFLMFRKFASKHHEFVVKPRDLSLAVGVHKFAVGGGTNKYETAFNKLLNEASEYRNKYKVGYAKRYADTPGLVLEEVIDQDESLCKIHPMSVNAVRCTTINIGGSVQVYEPWLKIGVNGEFLNGGGVGSLLAGVDVKTGMVNTIGYNEKRESFEYHPTTGIKIPGYVIPQWNELLKLLKKIGRKFPTINYIGWDMALSKKGWCIMEGNFQGEFLWQLVYEKGMKKEFEELIQWAPEKEIWWQN